ncbi:MAG: MFS transporter [Myxococcota bacterium]|nr:MFS transporter [Myxococcota bacterium]
MDDPLPPERLLSRPFLLCFWANMLQGVAFNLYLHFPAYLHDLGADDVEIGFLASLTALAAVALRQPVGRVMDRRGRRPVILLGGVLNVAVTAAYLGITEIGPFLYAVRIGHGLAEAALFTALFTYAADHVPERNRTQGLSLFGVSGMLPIALGGVLGDQVLASAGWPGLFWTAVGCAFVSLLLSLPMPEVPRPGEVLPGTTGLRAALRQPDLIPLWWIGLIFSLVLTAFFVFTRRFVDEAGVGSMSLFFTSYTVAALFLRVGFGWVPDRLGPKRVLAPSLGFLALGLVMLARADADLDLLWAGLCCGVGHGFTFPILFGLVVERTPAANRGMAMAVYTGLLDAGVLIGGPAMGFAVERAGFSAMYGLAAVALVVGGTLFFLWDARVARALRR